MSCSICGAYYGCNCGSSCVTENIQDCEHEDPGLETTGAHLAVLDYLFNERRLQNTPGFLVNRLAGAGYQIAWTLDPQVLHTGLNLPLDTTFTGLLAATGTTGNYRRLLPTAAGYLQGNADGTWQLVTAPTAVIPDPLTLTTLNAANAVIAALTVSGLPIFSALANDTITQNIGLNAADELVIGSVAQGSVAKFHESVTETGAGQPNAAAVANSYIKFTNEIYDADGIASPVNSERIKIDEAGTYEIIWGVGFGPQTNQNQGVEWFPVLMLEYNGALVSYGDNRYAAFASNKSCVAGGTFVANLAVNDFFQMKITGTMPNNASGTNSGVWDANMVLVRIK